MLILDRYITRRFCITLFYAILSFIFIVIFVDLIGNLGKFIDKDVNASLILKYYIYYIPYIIILALPIAMLLASLFSIGHMSKYNELTAIKSVGISLYRILLPILVCSFLISIFAIGLGEIIAPKTNQEKTKIENKYLKSMSVSSLNRAKNIYWRDKLNRRLFIGQFDNRTNIARKVTIQKYSGNQIVERIDAPKMEWQDSTWVLLNGYRRTFTDNKEEAISFDELNDYDIDIKPDKLIQAKIEPEDMSFEELKTFLNEVKRNGGDPNRWLVDLHFKISIPFANFIMVLFGAPLASQKKRSGALFGFMISLLICFIYYGSNRLLQTLGQNGNLSPFLAAWLTNVTFFVSGIILLVNTRK